MSTRLRTLLMTTAALSALGTVPGVAGPDGPAVVGGSASVSGAGTSSVIVNQSSSRAIINWTTFNLGKGETTQFNQPNSSSVVLNRVTGGLGASSIDGTVSANGKVFIVNRDGILFGPNAVINTGSFLATTHDIRNSDFMAGRMNFNIPGRSDASIVNLGRITAELGGFAALVAPGVRNSGTITATLGTVALASGNMFTLDMYGDKLIQLGVNDAVASQVIDVQTGQPLKSLVTNEGKLKANGGRVELTAVAARAVVDSVINNKGVIEANSVGTRNGKIVLGAATEGSKGAGAPKQTVRVSGKISAAGKKKGTTGGTVVITGEDIQFASAVIDASGRAGGGKIMIGGDWGGGNPDKSLVSNNASAALESYVIDRASTVSVDSGSRITASAKDSGNGGKVILWSDVATTYSGLIEARGGAASGDGGFVEVSSKGLLDYAGTVDTRAPYGTTGVLLLDPANVSINSVYNLYGGFSGNTWSPDGTNSTSYVTAATLEAALATSNVIVTTGGTGSPGGGVGDIFVSTNIAWSSNSTLTLSAYNDISFTGGVTITNTGGGNLILRADNSGIGTGTVSFASTNQINYSGSTGTVSIFYNPSSYSSPTDYSPHVSTNPSVQNQLTAYMLVNSVSNFRDINVNATTLAGTYALSKDLSGIGFGPFVPLGTFTGVFDGFGHTISNLSVSDPAPIAVNTGTIRNLKLDHMMLSASANDQYVGTLVGQNNGTIDNVQVTNSTVIAPAGLTGITAGGLAGLNTGTITNSSAAVTVTVGSGLSGSSGWNNAGGLVGINTGTISASSASGNVTSGNNSFAGGLVGQNGNAGNPGGNAALIETSSASGTVTSDYTAGGLAGVNFIKSDGSTSATIRNSSASGAVILNSGGFSAGGLVGQNEDRIESSFYAGTVTAVGTNSLIGASVGGLVGTSNSFVSGHIALITNSYSSGTVTGGDNTSVGGLVGFNGGQISDSHSASVVSGNGYDSLVGGLVGLNDSGPFSNGSITNSYAVGAVFGSNGATAGGFAGMNSDGGTISNSYATGAVTLTSQGAQDQLGGGFVGDNLGTITNSYSTGAVTAIGGDTMVGGFAGSNNFDGVILDSHVTGNVSVTGATLAFGGGFVGGNAGFIDPSYATGNVTINALIAAAGGFAGLNLGDITLSYATGGVTGGNNALVGGFVGFNLGLVNQAYASGAVVGGANSFVGGFVGVNLGITSGGSSITSPISQAYALGPATGGANSFVGGFAGLNFGTLDQVYGVGFVTAGAGSVTGGLVASNNVSFTIPDIPGFQTASPFTINTGVATNSYWDRQTTGQENSAGGTGLDSAVLAGGTMPPGFSAGIWTHGSYPQLVNLGSQSTIPGLPVLPPLVVAVDTPIPIQTPTLPPILPTPDHQIDVPIDVQVTAQLNSQAQVVNQLANPVTFNINATRDPLVIPPPLPVQQTQQVQGQQGQQNQQTPAAQTERFAGQIDAGPGRLFVVPLDETRIVANEVVLQMPCNVSQAALATVTRQTQLTVSASQCLGTSGLAVYRMQIGNGQTITSVIQALVAHQIVAVAQANYTYVMTQEQPTPAGEFYPDLSGRSREGDAAQYVLEKLRLPQIHRLVKGTAIKIAVIDSQIDASHPDLKDAIVARYDATGAEEEPHAHGTGMAGAIVSHNRLMGIAPGAQIAAIHAFGSSASAESTTFNILKGLDWASNNGVRIINMSFAGPRDPSLERALKAAHDKGVVLIGAAGNAGPRSPPLYPAADPNVIGVTATDIDDKLFSGANRGRYIAVAAPGVDILVPAPQNSYRMTTGTSVATAHISGIVALLLERNPQLKPDDIRRILTASAKRLGPNNEFGAGLVDPVKALELAAPRSASVPAATAR